MRERKQLVRETQTQEVSQRSRGNNLTTGVGHTHMKESEATRVGAHNAQDFYFTFTFYFTGSKLAFKGGITNRVGAHTHTHEGK